MSQRFAFEPAPPTTLGIAGSDQLFPVRRVYCVGLNYAEHVQEMSFGRTQIAGAPISHRQVGANQFQPGVFRQRILP